MNHLIYHTEVSRLVSRAQTGFPLQPELLQDAKLFGGFVYILTCDLHCS